MAEPIVLVHSPICGPFSWELVADELRRAGREVLVPPVEASEDLAQPFWRQHARGAAEAIATLPPSARPVLVGHSGSGVLLPPIRELSGRPAAAYVFTDAALPNDRLPRKGSEDSPFAHQLRDIYGKGGRYPNWTARDLGIPDEERCQRVVAEQRPQPLAFWDEYVPVFDGWPDAPCVYLHFSDSYDAYGAEALSRGWPYLRIQGRHFLPVIDPPGVAEGILQLLAEAGVK